MHIGEFFLDFNRPEATMSLIEPLSDPLLDVIVRRLKMRERALAGKHKS